MNIALIILDTLREDFARKYLDKIFKKFGFQRFTAYSTSNWTIPSHFSMFTGLLPSEHGIHETREKKAPIHQPIWEFDSIFKIARVFDYDIIWISANPFLTEEMGYSGIKEYYYTLPGSPRRWKKFPITIVKVLRRMKIIAKLYRFLRNKNIIARNWPLEKGISSTINILKRLKEKSFKREKFLFINLMEAHGPYLDYPKISLKETLAGKIKITKNISENLRNSYTKSIEYLKNKLEEFLISLFEFLSKNSIIFVLSDHGEYLGEHNLIGHEMYLWDELVKIPLWIYSSESFRENSKVISSKNIYKVIFNLILKREIIQDLLFSNYAFSENWGTIMVRLPKEISEKIEKYRIRCTSAKGSVIYNVDDDKIEWKEGHWKDCYEKIKKYIENPEEFSPGLF